VRGQLELAGAGTLLLDEIAEMPIELQAKLLRVIESRKFRPLGAEEEVTLDARIIAATHVDLERRIENGTFREDLYFRLNVVTIDVPALSERGDDIPHLVQTFASEQTRAMRFTDAAITWLRTHHWPGNVRELKNAIERLALLSESDVIDVPILEELVGNDSAVVERELTRLAKTLLTLTTKEPSKLDAIQRALVEQALAVAKGNKSAAARLLGVHRKMLERMVKAEATSDEVDDE
jgi:DNA-binding NtrC family response regulator